jgi:hypothetical protein
MIDKIDALRAAKARNEFDEYLDGLGRPMAAKVAPDLVSVANVALNMVSGRSPRPAPTHRKPNPAREPSLFDRNETTDALKKKMKFAEYVIGGEVYSIDEVFDRFELILQLERQRRAEAEEWQRREDHARIEASWAFSDANILLVIGQRIRAEAA